jgi:hypothetical protein
MLVKHPHMNQCLKCQVPVSILVSCRGIGAEVKLFTLNVILAQDVRSHEPVASMKGDILYFTLF